MQVSPFSAGYIGEQFDKAAKASRAKRLENLQKAMLTRAHRENVSKEPKTKRVQEDGKVRTQNAMEQAQFNLLNKQMARAKMNDKGEIDAKNPIPSVNKVMRENMDMRTPEQREASRKASIAGRTNADIAGRTNADIAASQPSATARVMQSDEPSQSAFSGARRTGSLSSRQATSAGQSGNLQANRTGSLSNRGTRQVGRGYHSEERQRERASRRNEEASVRAYGF